MRVFFLSMFLLFITIGSYAETFEEFLKAAKQGDASAQAYIGWCYHTGNEVAQDLTEAVRWYKMAAMQGDPDAQRNLGLCYANGQGVPQNYSEAAKWYRKAALQGNADAQGNLGWCYETGNGVPKNLIEAVKWYRKAADQGNIWAEETLGGCYIEGTGVKQDYVEAVKWYRKAADQGDPWALSRLGWCYSEGIGVKQDYVEAVKWYTKAAELGDAYGQVMLGWCYDTGNGVPQNYIYAYMWYNFAAAQSTDDNIKTTAVTNRNIIIEKMSQADISEAQRLTREWKPSYMTDDIEPATTADAGVISGEELTLSSKIKKYVEPKILEWQKKGEFEKTADYQNRVNNATRQKKIQEYSNEVLALYKEKYLRGINWSKLTLKMYDADNETFLVVLPDSREIAIKIPIAEATVFKADWKELQVIDPDAVVVDDSFVITKLTFKNMKTQKTYVYDNKIPTTYNASKIAYNFGDIEVDIPHETVDTTVITSTTTLVGNSDIDTRLPVTQTVNPDAVAVIIGNKDYKKTKSVDFALNDAQTMKNYLITVFGYKEGNILMVQNATKGDFETMFGTTENFKGKLYNLIKQGKSDVFIYYVGHGAPSTNTKKGYFVPVECDPQYVDLGGYSIDTFYANCAKLNTRSTTIVLDACFSGADLLTNISPMILEVDNPVIDLDNTVVFASSSGSQVSTWYTEKGHSMFTYFFLKGIHSKEADLNKDGKITVNELYTYISDNNDGVPYYARRLFGIEQTPTVESKDRSKVIVTY